MGGHDAKLTGPDLAAGVRAAELREGEPLVGHAAGEAVVLVRRGDDVFATGASCTHYGGPLGEGLVVGETIRCPWHHACFDLRTGEAIGAPALNPVPCYEVRRSGDLVVVGNKRSAQPHAIVGGPASVVVVGAGAAGAACVEALRREGYGGPIALIGAEDPGPVDRPNLSKDYLAGNAPDEWIPLRGPEFYAELEIDFVANDPVTAIDVAARTVRLRSGRALPFGALVLATGGEPNRLPIPGADRPHVLRLRTLADSRAIVAAATKGKRAVIIGASFIGLEVAASLRARGVEVDVVGREAVPLARVLGDELGRFVRDVHVGKGTRFHLGVSPRAIGEGTVDLDDGRSLPADFVVLGVGVKPRVELAQAAGLRVDDGIVVDGELRTSAPGVWAAGDVARYPEPRVGALARVEHWVLAERQGQAVARSIVGRGRPFTDVPFFWSIHHDVTINYVGYAPAWDAVEVRGSLAARDAAIAYRRGGRTLAVATIGRDRLALEASAALERADFEAVDALLAQA